MLSDCIKWCVFLRWSRQKNTPHTHIPYKSCVPLLNGVRQLFQNGVQPSRLEKMGYVEQLLAIKNVSRIAKNCLE